MQLFSCLVIKKKQMKMNQAMVFPKSLSKQKVRPVSKVKSDENDAGQCSLNLNENTTNKSASPSYNLWMVKHPCALRSFDRMMKAAKGKRVVVFLDYDGTLSPIVNDPDRAFMSDEMRCAVREVAKYFPTAIISGRRREKVKEFVRLNNVYYAGSHGMDIMVPAMPLKSCCGGQQTSNPNKKGRELIFQPAKKFLPAIEEMFTILKEKLSSIQGAKIEDNGFCISVHYRHVLEEDYGVLEKIVKSVLSNHQEFHLTEGKKVAILFKKVMEIRPSIDWNKGHALEYFLDTLGLNNSEDVLPLYIGDDRTDEDAFEVIQRRGQGYSIVVSSTPKDTKATYSMYDPSEVLIFLLRLTKWRKTSSLRRLLN